jgi:hypothetical protein
MSWPSPLDQHERIPRMCLIRMSSQVQVLAGPPPNLAGHDPAGSGLEARSRWQSPSVTAGHVTGANGGMNVSSLAFSLTFWRYLKRHVGCNATRISTMQALQRHAIEGETPKSLVDAAQDSISCRSSSHALCRLFGPSLLASVTNFSYFWPTS